MPNIAVKLMTPDREVVWQHTGPSLNPVIIEESLVEDETVKTLGSEFVSQICRIVPFLADNPGVGGVQLTSGYILERVSVGGEPAMVAVAKEVAAWRQRFPQNVSQVEELVRDFQSKAGVGVADELAFWRKTFPNYVYRRQDDVVALQWESR